MRRLVTLLAAGLLLASTVSFGQEAKPKTYTLVLEGAVWQGCVGQLADAIKSVDGAKIITPPALGTGENKTTVAVVELSGKATLGKVITAVEEAKTPHAKEVPPDVSQATTLKFKPAVTMDAIMEALKKADLLAD